MLFVKVSAGKGNRKVSSLGAATERLDRRMNSLIEAYQGVFAGTRIATLGLRWRRRLAWRFPSQQAWTS
jgi:hypothetical protein